MADFRLPAACISLAGVTLFYLLFQQKQYQKGSNRKLALFYKCLATCFAACLGLFGAVLSPSLPHILLVIGLFTGAAADVVLGKKFIPGMGVFAVGHLFYCIACLLSAPPTWVSLILFLLLMIVTLILYPHLKKAAGKRPLLPFIAYGVLLFLTLSLSAAQEPLLLSGMILFVASDCMLGFRIFTENRSKFLDYFCLACYYLGQFLIGASVIF